MDDGSFGSHFAIGPLELINLLFLQLSVDFILE